MSKKESEEASQRFQPRVPLEKDVLVKCEDWAEFRSEFGENISEGGIFLKTDEVISAGEVFNLTLDVKGERLQVKAQVIWTKEFSDERGRKTGCGARFLDLEEETRKIIRDFVDLALADD